MTLEVSETVEGGKAAVEDIVVRVSLAVARVSEEKDIMLSGLG